MQFSHLQRIGHVGAAITLFCGTAGADTFHLKDGRSLEGSILREDEDSYRLEVVVGRGIKDEISISKSDISRIEREVPEQTEFTELQELIPVPDLLPSAQYTQRIAKMREFMATYPESTMLEEVETILNTHLEELAIIEAGGLKLNGKLIPPNGRLADKYHIDSRVAETEVRRLAHTSGHLNALREFKSFEADFMGSEAWYSLLPLANQLAVARKVRAQELLEGFEQRLANQEAGLSRMGIEERQTSLRAIAERDAALEQRHNHERSLKDHWPSMSADYKPSLEDTVRFADQEIRRITAASSQPLREPTPSQIWRDGVAAIQAGEENQIRTALQAARSARMPQRYIDELQSLAEEAGRKAEESRRHQEEAANLAEEAKQADEEE